MIITDTRGKEPDLLAGNELRPLEIRDLDGTVLMKMEPTMPWTTERLEAAIANEVPDEFTAWDAFLGEQFVGSTEC